ncbi:MAG: hypothetical protein ACI9UK_001084 [Candidatus Krumholzibacteriia bacterium]|jgi:hypothetical protein
MIIKRICTGLVLSVFLLGMVGCSDGETIVDLPPIPQVYGSTTELVEAYIKAYETPDTMTLAKVLDPDFNFMLNQETRVEFPDVGAFFNHADEVRIAGRLFSGDPVTTPGGNHVPGVSGITVAEFQIKEDWAFLGAGPETSNDYRATFAIELWIARPGFIDFMVKGELIIDARAWSSENKGEGDLSWKIVGIVDNTFDQKKGNEFVSMGSLKALYWVPEPSR